MKSYNTKRYGIMYMANDKIVCDRCNGSGIQQAKLIGSKEEYVKVPIKCQKCSGDGYLDWIENIVGKK